MGRRISTRDPQGRVIQRVWCSCGAPNALIDANGNKTTWERDWQNRVVREVHADGVTDTLFNFDPTGRLHSMTDPLGQVLTFTYDLADDLGNATFTNAVVATPSVSYTHDPVYKRPLTMQDGIGTTTFSYHPPGVPGAGKVATIDGPFANDTIAYSYDELGRPTTRTINGSANAATWTFDALGRPVTETNALGSFVYTYDGFAARPASVEYPNGQTTTFSYLSTTEDHRLETIHHKDASGATLSKHDYTYDFVGNLLTWRQQSGSEATIWRYSYDAIDQVTAAIRETTDTPPTILKRHLFAYDPAGNRLFEQTDDNVLSASYDKMNRLLSQAPGGPLGFAGTVDEPATVTVGGRPAAVSADLQFRGTADAVAGTSAVTVVATDPNGNVANQAYEVDIAGTARFLTYDANGNTLSDGHRTFEWNAFNQLVSVVKGVVRTEFYYDGMGRRVRTRRVESGVMTASHTSVWCEVGECEKRSASGAVVEAIDTGLGRLDAASAVYRTVDHLQSVVTVTDETGSLLEHYDYDPWGRRTAEFSVLPNDRSFATLQWNDASELWLSKYRVYDSDLGRWSSPDPAGLVDGPNRYLYTRNRPIAAIDPTGLVSVTPCGGVYLNFLGGLDNSAWIKSRVPSEYWMNNNQAVFCAACGPCERRAGTRIKIDDADISLARWLGLTGEWLSPVSGPDPVNPLSQVIEWNLCLCDESDRVYANVGTRFSIWPIQFVATIFKATLEYDCIKQ